MSFQIAIDGPVAAGKGTVAKLLAKRLNFLYVDTGAMYRVAAYLAINNQVSLDDENLVAKIVDEAKIEMRNPSDSETDGRLTTVLVNEVDVSWAIRTEEVGMGASKVATYPLVRKVLVAKQQNIAANTDVVMEGRDITYRVLPTAQLKIYLTASETARAKRRYLDLINRGQDISMDEVLSDLKERDYQDTHRSVDPLQVVEDAMVIDTTNLDIESVVEILEVKVNSKIKSK